MDPFKDKKNQEYPSASLKESFFDVFSAIAADPLLVLFLVLLHCIPAVVRYFTVSVLPEFFFILFLLWVDAFMIRYFYSNVSKTYEPISEVAKQSLRRFPRFILIYIFNFWIAMVGTLCFLLPGVYFGSRYFVVLPAAAVSDRKETDFFRMSYELTRGNMKEIFAVYLVLAAAWVAMLWAAPTDLVEEKRLAYSLAYEVLGAFGYSFWLFFSTAYFFRIKSVYSAEEKQKLESKDLNYARLFKIIVVLGLGSAVCVSIGVALFKNHLRTHLQEKADELSLETATLLKEIRFKRPEGWRLYCHKDSGHYCLRPDNKNGIRSVHFFSLGKDVDLLDHLREVKVYKIAPDYRLDKSFTRKVGKRSWTVREWRSEERKRTLKAVSTAHGGSLVVFTYEIYPYNFTSKERDQSKAELEIAKIILSMEFPGESQPAASENPFVRSEAR